MYSTRSAGSRGGKPPTRYAAGRRTKLDADFASLGNASDEFSSGSSDGDTFTASGYEPPVDTSPLTRSDLHFAALTDDEPAATHSRWRKRIADMTDYGNAIARGQREADEHAIGRRRAQAARQNWDAQDWEDAARAGAGESPRQPRRIMHDPTLVRNREDADLASLAGNSGEPAEPTDWNHDRQSGRGIGQPPVVNMPVARTRQDMDFQSLASDDF